MKPMIDSKQALLAPDFNAQDSEGRQLRLSDFKNKKNVMLVFNRGFQ
jgi:peroxiredoxin